VNRDDDKITNSGGSLRKEKANRRLLELPLLDSFLPKDHLDEALLPSLISGPCVLCSDDAIDELR
jgi:hypothetical protein